METWNTRSISQYRADVKTEIERTKPNRGALESLVSVYNREVHNPGVSSICEPTEEALKAMNSLVLCILIWSAEFVKRYRWSDLSFEDLLQAAGEGAIKASRKYDQERGSDFMGYASYYMRRAAWDEIAKEAFPFSIPINVARSILRGEGARTSDREVEDDAGEYLEDFQKTVKVGDGYMELTLSYLPMETPLPQEGLVYHPKSAGRIDIEDIEAEDPLATAIKEDTTYNVDKLLQRILSSRENQVLRMRFGMLPYKDEHTLEEIGAYIGITRQRIMQIERRALRKLREDASIGHI